MKLLNSASIIDNDMKKRKVAPKRKSTVQLSPLEKICTRHKSCRVRYMELGVQGRKITNGNSTGWWEHFSNDAPITKKDVQRYKALWEVVKNEK